MIKYEKQIETRMNTTTRDKQKISIHMFQQLFIFCIHIFNWSMDRKIILNEN